MMTARPRDSIAIVLLGVCLLHLAVLSDPCATTAEEPHKKVWGKVVRVESNHVVIVEDPAGLEMRLHGNTTTVTRLQPGELVKASCTPPFPILDAFPISRGRLTLEEPNSSVKSSMVCVSIRPPARPPRPNRAPISPVIPGTGWLA